ncbi:hypothetical protein XPR_1714, partial [Xanthomonas arboricola pv. pruni MAFF 301420]
MLIVLVRELAMWVSESQSESQNMRSAAWLQ